MLAVTFSYNPLTSEVSLTDDAPIHDATYQLVEVSGADHVLASGVGGSVAAVVRQDGVYKLVLQLLEYLGGVLTIKEQSEPVYHLQLAGSLCREAVLYSAAIQACKADFREVLCERYNRQKAVLAYQNCNTLVADKLLKGGCQC